MTTRPGFKVTRVEVEDDEIIELESIASEGTELDELLATFDELRAELDRVRHARDVLFEQTKKLRDELATVRAELRTAQTENELRRLGLVGAGERQEDDGRRFVPDGRGGEIEVTNQGDLTRHADQE